MPVDHCLHHRLEHVFVYDFDDPWTWDELMFAFNAELEYSRSLPRGERYLTLVLMSHARSMVPGLSLFHFQYMQKNDPPNWDYMIIVRDPSRFFNPLFMAANNNPQWRNRVFMVDTFAEAEQIIHADRANGGAP